MPNRTCNFMMNFESALVKLARDLTSRSISCPFIKLARLYDPELKSTDEGAAICLGAVQHVEDAVFFSENKRENNLISTNLNLPLYDDSWSCLVGGENIRISSKLFSNQRLRMDEFYSKYF